MVFCGCECGSFVFSSMRLTGETKSDGTTGAYALVVSGFCGGGSGGGGSVTLVAFCFWVEVHHHTKVCPWIQGAVDW